MSHKQSSMAIVMCAGVVARLANGATVQYSFDQFAAGQAVGAVTSNGITATFPLGVEVFQPLSVATASPPNAIRPSKPWADGYYPSELAIQLDRPSSSLSLAIGNDDASFMRSSLATC